MWGGWDYDSKPSSKPSSLARAMWHVAMKVKVIIDGHVDQMGEMPQIFYFMVEKVLGLEKDEARR